MPDRKIILVMMWGY